MCSFLSTSGYFLPACDQRFLPKTVFLFLNLKFRTYKTISDFFALRTNARCGIVLVVLTATVCIFQIRMKTSISVDTSSFPYFRQRWCMFFSGSSKHTGEIGVFLFLRTSFYFTSSKENYCARVLAEGPRCDSGVKVSTTSPRHYP